MTLRMGLVASRDDHRLTPGDRRLQRALAEEDIPAEPVIWTDRTVDWEGFPVLLIRSTWDYDQNYESFRQWLIKRERQGIRLINPLSILRWNLAKTYLHDLHEWGLPIVPTAFAIPPFDERDRSLLQRIPWRDLIVKPIVGAGAWDLVRVVDPDPTDWQSVLYSRPMRRGCLVQPFMDEIRDGEWSFIFLQQQLSHAVLKRPDQDDFRVQERYGGRRELADPPSGMEHRIRDHFSVLFDRLSDRPVYARLDVVGTGENLRIMEVEMVEPDLYLETRRLAENVAAHLCEELDGSSPGDAVMTRHSHNLKCS